MLCEAVYGLIAPSKIFTVLIIVPAEAMETAIACTVSVLIEATIATVEATEAALRTFSASKAAGSAEHLL